MVFAEHFKYCSPFHTFNSMVCRKERIPGDYRADYKAILLPNSKSMNGNPLSFVHCFDFAAPIDSIIE